MDRHSTRNNTNDVNGSNLIQDHAANSSDQSNHLRQVVPDRHQATAGADYMRQVVSHCNNATVRLKTTQKRKIGTWNVKTLRRAGKVHNVAAEAKRLKIDILGLSEVWWPGVGQMTVEG